MEGRGGEGMGGGFSLRFWEGGPIVSPWCACAAGDLLCDGRVAARGGGGGLQREWGSFLHMGGVKQGVWVFGCACVCVCVCACAGVRVCESVIVDSNSFLVLFLVFCCLKTRLRCGLCEGESWGRVRRGGVAPVSV